MKRIRLSTLMLLVVIAALGTALVVREWRDARHKAYLQASMAEVLVRAASEQQKFMNAQKKDNGTTKQADAAGEKR